MTTVLQSEDKFKRRFGLKELLKRVDIESNDEQKLLEMWESCSRPVIRTLLDPMEECRDLSLDILKQFIKSLPCSDKNIVYIIPLLVKRLSPQELTEPSEEIRLKSIQLLRIIIDKYQEQLTAYFEDLTKILTRTLQDKYPSVILESCECIRSLAKALPSEFIKKTETFIKLLIGNLKHMYHRVRSANVKTIGEVMFYGDSKQMDIVSGALAERLFDQSGPVRAVVIEVVAKWMFKLRDRYSWGHKLIPLLLTGMSDVIAEIRDKSTKLWFAVGQQYIKENDTDKKFKEKLDYLPEVLEHYPPKVIRPNLGCRTLVQQNFGKLNPAISRELNDWMGDIKLRSAQLLCILALNVEDEITNHIVKLLPAMNRACNDEDKRVVENVELAAEYMAYFVPINVFLNFLMPSMSNSTTKGHLKILAAITRGSRRKDLDEELIKIIDLLKTDDICLNTKYRYQLQVLDCCRSLLKICKNDCVKITKDLFKIIVKILALSSHASVTNRANDLLQILVKINDYNNIDELYRNYTKDLLFSIKESPETWKDYSSEYAIFQACLTQLKSGTYDHLNLICSIFEKTTSIDSDPKLRLKQYITLSAYFQQWNEPFGQEEKNKAFADFTSTLLKNVIIPGLYWTAGKTAEATRTASVCCLCALLNTLVDNCTSSSDNDLGKKSKFVISVEDFGWLFHEVAPVLINLMEDDSEKTRFHSLQAICLVINIGQELSCVTEEHIHKMNPEILTRLEDQSDDVRSAAIEAVEEIWKVLPKNYDLSFYYVHIEYAYSKIMTHLDDPGIKFQEQALDCLMKLSKVHPELLIEKIQESRSLFINQKALDQLSTTAQTYLKK